METSSLVIDPIIFEKPERIKEPLSWVPHIPFSFFLVKHYSPEVIVELGTHSGNSYFSFCQIVKKLGLSTKCYAVDTWLGDEMAGFYDEIIFEDVKKYNEEKYAAFSTLVRKTFDEAVEDFENSSIDLLHIDGLHTYEAVKNDFEKWYPKLSNRAVVLFHDIHEREADFGVWKFWEEIKKEYDFIEFIHSHGLGVLLVGDKLSDEFKLLLKDIESKDLYKILFQKLGYSNLTISFPGKPKQDNSQVAKLYLATDREGFSEKNTLRTEVSKDTKFIEYQLERFEGLTRVRFDPLEDFVRIRLLDALLYHSKTKIERLKPAISNCIEEDESGALLFDTKDPQLIFDFSEIDYSSIEKLIISVEYLTIGSKVLHEIIDLKNYKKQNDGVRDNDKGSLGLEKHGSGHDNDGGEKRNGFLTVIDSTEFLSSVINEYKILTEKYANQLLEREKIIQEKERYLGEIQVEKADLMTELSELNIEKDQLIKKEIGSIKEELKQIDNSTQRELNKLENTFYEVSKKLFQLVEQNSLETIGRIDEQRMETNKRISVLHSSLNELKNQVILGSEKINTLTKQNTSLKYELEKQNNTSSRTFDRLSALNENLIKIKEQQEASEKRARIKENESWTKNLALSFRNLIAKFSRDYRLISKSSLFNQEYYLKSNPDVAESNINPILHYLKYGGSEGRNPSPVFNSTYYLKSNPDVSESGMNPLVHYLRYGKNENRSPLPSKEGKPEKPEPEVSIRDNSGPKKQEDGRSGKQILPVFRQAEKKVSYSKKKLLDPRVFDWQYYIEQNKDVKNYAGGKKEKAEKHWLEYGIKEGRIASHRFDVNFYINHNRDVKNFINGDNALAILHYLNFGIKEGRSAFFDETKDSRVFRFFRGNLEPQPEKKNVVIVAHSVSNRIYGGERSFLDIVKSIDKNKYNVYVVIPRYNASFLSHVRDYTVEVVCFEYVWWKKGHEKAEEFINKFRTIFRQLRADLVHINTIVLLDAIIAAKEEKIVSFTHVREIISKDKDLIDLIGYSSEEIIQMIRNSSDYLIVNSKSTLDEFHKNDKSFLLYNTIDDNLFDLSINIEGALKIGIISSNIPKKGIMDFIHIADLVYEQNQNIEFYIIGEETELIRQIKAEQLEGEHSPQIFFPGYMPDSSSAHAKLDVVCNFSHFAESFGRTIAEGMAAGRPVIGYDWGALSELIDNEENGYLIEYRNWQRAAEVILHLDNNRSLVKKYGDNGREKAWQNYSSETFQQKLNSIYEDVLNNENRCLFKPSDEVGFIDQLSQFNKNVARKKEKELKVGYFLWHFPVPSETFVLNELRYLKEEGINVQVFCKGSPYKDFEPSFAIKYTRVRTVQEFKEQLVSNQISVVHSHFTYPTVTTFVWPACSELNIPFSFIAHAQDIFKYENIKVNRIEEIVKSASCLRLFLPGKFHKKFLTRRGIPFSKISINPQIIYKEDFSFQNKKKFRGTICALGRFVEKKGFENLIEAAGYLDEHGIELYLYGYGDLESHYQEIISKKEIKNVRLAGRLNGSAEVSEALKSHDILIQPSVVSQDGDMDGVPTVLMEAMNSGTLVLSTRIASIPDLISDGSNGFLLNSIEPGRIAEKILEIYSIPFSYATYLRKNAKKQIDRFYNIEKNVSHLLDIWREYTVDIVIVSFVNDEYENLEELKEVIYRIYTFTQTKFNLFVVDNGSDDRTREFLEYLDNQLDNFHYHPQDENLYVGSGTNVALEVSSSEFVFYICGVEGFVIDNGWETDAIHYMRENGKVGLAGTLGYSPSYLKGSDYPKGIKEFEKFRNKDFAKDNPEKTFKHIQGGLIVIRREMYEEIGGFNPKVPHNYTDVEYSYYAESCGWELGEIPSFLALYEKTRPKLHSKLDEYRKIIHPGLLDDSELYQKIVEKETKLCNVCGWSGNQFAADNTECPNCNSTPKDRSLYRYLAESTLTYRRLKGLYVNPSEALKAFWEKSFQGRMLNMDQLEFEIAEKGNIDFATDSLDLIVISCGTQDIMNSSQEFLGELKRILNPDGILIIQDIYDQESFFQQDQEKYILAKNDLISFYTDHFQLLEDMAYESAVVNFDYHSLFIMQEITASVTRLND